MLRWLGRLLLIGLILAAIGFAASRLLGQDDDFDDFDDIEEGFDYQETPLEIAVPAGDAGGSASAGSASAGGAGAGTGTDGASTATEPGLQDIKGIGPAYEQRLQALGINSVSELVSADAGSLSEQLDVVGGRETIEGWLAQARDLTSGGSSSGGSSSDGQDGSQSGTND